jgi:pimeloyl-ACP methyl ester carboxylesterase
VPNSKFAVIKYAAHMTMQDNPEQDIQEIRSFLDEIEKY